MVEHHQQEQGDAQEVGEQGELDVRDHDGMFVKTSGKLEKLNSRL